MASNPDDENAPSGSVVKEYQIKKQGAFNFQFSIAVPDAAQRTEIERTIRFMLRYGPEAGEDTGRASPAPVYILRFRQSIHGPELLFYYCFWPFTVLLMGVDIADPPEE